MSWTLTITDNADGTGATAAVTGSGSAWHLQRAAVVVSGTGTYATVGTGESPVELTQTITGTGYYSWQLVDHLGTTVLAGPVYQPITSGGDSVHERCLTMLSDRLKSLALKRSDGGLVGVYTKALPTSLTNTDFPCVLLSLAFAAEESQGGTLSRDDVGFPVRIDVIDREAAGMEINRPTFLHYRYRIAASINMNRWDARVPEVWKVEVRPAQVIDGGSEKAPDLRFGVMTAVCVARLSRGTTVGVSAAA